jgi:hypothetical protein
VRAAGVGLYLLPEVDLQVKVEVGSQVEVGLQAGIDLRVETWKFHIIVSPIPFAEV